MKGRNGALFQPHLQRNFDFSRPSFLLFSCSKNMHRWHILTNVVKQILHACVRNLKQMSNIDFQQDLS